MNTRIFLFSAAIGAAALTTMSAAQAQVATTPETGTVITTAIKTRKVPDPTKFEQGVGFPYWVLDRAFQGHVNHTGLVDYAGLKGDPYLDAFVKGAALADISKFPVLTLAPLPDDKDNKPRPTRMAELVFWINAYNANVLKAISDAYPINRIDEIKNFDTASTRVIAGKNYSFRELRAKIAAMDPRALFALTDGTKGGPLLAPAAYRLYGFNDLLEIAVQNFVRDPRNVEVNRLQNVVYINDFAKQANTAFAPDDKNGSKLRGVRNILASYTDNRSGRSFLNTGDYRIELRPADRSLNQGTAATTALAATGGATHPTGVNASTR
jgi:hypothetical protein